MVSGLNWLQGIQVSLRADAQHKPPFCKGGRKRKKILIFFSPLPLPQLQFTPEISALPAVSPAASGRTPPPRGGKAPPRRFLSSPLRGRARPRLRHPAPGSAPTLRSRAAPPRLGHDSGPRLAAGCSPGPPLRRAPLRSAAPLRAALRAGLAAAAHRAGPSAAPRPPRALIGRRDKSFCGDGGAAR